MSLPFLRKRQRYMRRVRKIMEKWSREYRDDSMHFATVIVEHPDEAREFIELNVALGNPVSERVIAHLGIDVEEVRKRYWS